MKKYSKPLSIFLLITFIFSLLPIKAFAEELNKSSKLGTPPVQAKKKTEGKILKEVVEKREKNVKTFQLDDYSFQAAIFPEAVHYLKDGKWEDIDDSMVDATDEDKNNVYENKENSYKIKIAKKASANKLVRIQKVDTKYPGA